MALRNYSSENNLIKQKRRSLINQKTREPVKEIQIKQKLSKNYQDNHLTSSSRMNRRQSGKDESNFDKNEMILVSRSTIDKLANQIILLKRTLKNQKKYFQIQLIQFKQHLQSQKNQNKLLKKQSEYLKDMKKSHSEGKFNHYLHRFYQEQIKQVALNKNQEIENQYGILDCSEIKPNRVERKRRWHRKSDEEFYF